MKPRLVALAAALDGAWRRLLALPPRRAAWLVWTVLAVPFVVAVVVLHGRNWHPVLDLAMTELRVRDVGGARTPLIGLPGRIGRFPDQGSHPGPLSFYLLAPVYRAFASTAWSLLLSMVVLDLIAIGAVMWLAQRRRSTRLVLAAGGFVVIVIRGYGMLVLTQPWNPYLPLLCWLVVMFAAWSVLLGDHRMVIVVAIAGSVAAQTHMPYLGLCVGLGGLCVAAMVLGVVRHPLERAAVGSALAGAGVVSLVLWTPVVIDQIRNTPGNLSMLNTYFRNPPEEPVGLGEGVALLLRHLDVWRVVSGTFGGDGFFVDAAYRLDGTVVPGLLFIVVWFAAVVVAWRMRHRALLALHALLGFTMTLAIISMGRIFGKVWYYLTLWAWSVTLLALVSVIWTGLAAATHPWKRPRLLDHGWLGNIRLRRAPGVVVAAFGVLAVLSLIPLTVDAATVEAPEQHLSDGLAALVGPTADALRDGAGLATGVDGIYVITWSDALYFGSQGYGLVNELERRGFRVGVPNTWRVPVTQHRVIEPTAATAGVHLATGSYIEQWRATPDAVEVAFVEPRDDAELAEYAALEADVRGELETAGLAELVPLLDTNLFGLQLDQRVSVTIQRNVDRMLRLGQPEAVFVIPPQSSGE
jgi:hypothetical protein